MSWVTDARAAVDRREWREALTSFARADAETDAGAGLSAADLELWATAAYLMGRVADAVDALSRAVREHNTAERWEQSAIDTFWIVFMLAGQGELAQVSGWLGRARPVLDRLADDSAGRAYFACMEAFRHTAMANDFEEGARHGLQALDVAREVPDPDLLVTALNVAGRSLIRKGSTRDGIALLDEAMVEILGGAVSPIPAGTVYCSVIEACEEIADVRRAREWTDALDAWCSRQGDMVTFTGRCLIHRSTILGRLGEWDDAVVEARRACDRLSGAADEVSSGRAHYQLGELARMTGDHRTAEEEYRTAAEWGHDPQPGLALLRLAQGKRQAATAMMRRLDAEHTADHARASFLPAFVRIMLEAGALDAARQASSELERIAGTFGTECLGAEADRASGLVALAGGDPDGALSRLRRSCAAWKAVGAPFEEANTRLEIARTCRELGDAETAELEEAVASRTLESLGLDPTPKAAARTPETHGLTPRELDVLELLATGITNQDIADRLYVAVRTVDRHVANILTKLGVPSRTAATAYAYEHGLI